MSTGTGSLPDPIIAMSADPAQIALDVRVSLAAFGIPEREDFYWVDKASRPAEFSNHVWHLGWNAYWEARALPGNQGSADPNLGRLPAVHTRTPVVPPPNPAPAPIEPAPLSEVLAALTFARLNAIDARLTALEDHLIAIGVLAEHLAAQAYAGTVTIPYLGAAPITLRPKA